MWFWKRTEKVKEDNCKKLTQERLEIDLLRDKICQVQDDLTEFHKVHNQLANEFISLSGVVQCLYTRQTEVKSFIDLFSEMIITGHRLLGYADRDFPNIEKAKKKKAK